MNMFYTRTTEPFVWGHRGVPAAAVENTIDAFVLAAERQLDGFEFDVQFSSDDVPFVFHDDTLQRLVGRDQRAEDLTWRELQALQLKDPERPTLPGRRIPSLDEVLAFSFGTTLALNLEIKSSSRVEHRHLKMLWEMVQSYNLGARTLISSFYHPFLETMFAIAPEVMLAALWENTPNEDELRSIFRLTRTMHVRYTADIDKTAQSLRRLGCEVAVWGIHGPYDVAMCRNTSAHALFVDDTEWL